MADILVPPNNAIPGTGFHGMPAGPCARLQRKVRQAPEFAQKLQASLPKLSGSLVVWVFCYPG